MIRPLLSRRSDGIGIPAAEWERAEFVEHGARLELFRRALHLKLVRRDLIFRTRSVRMNWQAFADRLSALPGLFAGRVTIAERSAVVSGGRDGSL